MRYERETSGDNSEQRTSSSPIGRDATSCIGLMLTMALVAMDTTVVATAVPSIVQDLGGFSQFTWVFSIYVLVQAVTIPIYGKLADLYGRKPILLFGIGDLHPGLDPFRRCLEHVRADRLPRARRASARARFSRS